MFGRPRRAGVNDEAHVRAIDAHPERHRRHHDVDLFVEKGFLVPGAHVVGQPRVIRNRAEPLAGQPVGRLLHLATRQAIDDARLVLMAGEDAKNLAPQVGPAQHAVGEVRTIEPADEHERLVQPELRDDVPAHPLGGGRGERVHRDAGELIAQPPELAVLGPEIVPPLADAVRLVDGDEPHAAFAQEAAQAIAALADEPLRRHVEQPARIGSNPRQHLVALRQRQRAVQVGGRHAIHPKAIDLILHQRDQRRNDERHAAARRGRLWVDDRRRLEAQRLAAAGRQHDDAVAALEDRLHRLALQRTEVGEPPDTMKRRRAAASRTMDAEIGPNTRLPITRSPDLLGLPGIFVR